MKGTVKRVVAVTTIALCAGAASADSRHVNQDQMEDILYGNSVVASVGEPFGQLIDDRRHYGDLLYNSRETEQPSSYHPYVRVKDDRDYSEDLVYGSEGFESQDGIGPYVAGQ